jgi:hypothetical protein
LRIGNPSLFVFASFYDTRSNPIDYRLNQEIASGNEGVRNDERGRTEIIMSLRSS